MATLLEELLLRERELTAAERFSRWHSQAGGRAPGQVGYSQLLPLSHPRPGEQYGFEVDLDACSGCKACVTACHSLNGLEEDESWRSVGLLTERRPDALPDVAGLQHVTTACHHCGEPACAHGCPVLAYEKDAVTGIVRHLDDQCIGCSYCTLMCPYEVPRYSPRLGIVRKCDLCHGRLVAGQAPACAEACPNEAIRIQVVPSPSRTPGSFHFASPDPRITHPSTRYRSRRSDLATLRAADEADARPAPAHRSLVVMLTLTQLAAGGFTAATVTGASFAITLAATAALAAGLIASAFHLGQPVRAWRVFLGWRRSWLSREALLLGAFLAGAVACMATHLVPGLDPHRPLFTGLTALVGLLGVGASAMVYVATRRPAWSATRVFLRFGGTTVMLGAALTPGGSSHPTLFAPMLVILGALAVATTLLEPLRHRHSPWTASRRSAALLLRPFHRHLVACLVLLAAGACLAWASAGTQPPLAILAIASLTGASLLERHLFFIASSPDRMPGGIAP